MAMMASGTSGVPHENLDDDSLLENDLIDADDGTFVYPVLYPIVGLIA